MVTIRDVAKESGFSSTTVSIVLNNAPLARYIPPATKKKIERAAEKLGYRANQFARSLRSKRSHTAMIGCELKTDSISSVIVDNEVGGHLALEHLHSLGHRKIAIIRGPKGLIDSSPRWRGIRNFAKESGLELDARLIVDMPESSD